MMFGATLLPPKKKRSDADQDQAEAEPGTELIRVMGDLARMIAMIVKWRKPLKTAQFLDPQLRPFVEAEYAQVLKEMVEKQQREKPAR